MASNNYIYKMSNAGGMSTITRYVDMLAGNTTWSPWEPAGAYDALATVTVGSTAVSDITFTGIPTGYKHLQIRGILLSSSGQNNLSLRCNSDTAANYSSHQLQGDGASAAANSSVSQTFIGLMGLVTNTSIYPFITVIDILDYQSTTKAKTVRGLSGQEGNASGTATNWRLQLSSGAWYNSSTAISSLNISVPTYTIGQYSSFALYGVK